MYLGLYFRAIHQQCMLFWIGNGGTLIEFKREIKLVHEIDLVCDHLHHTKGLLITNWEPSELSLYKFKPVWRITFETLWDKLQNLLGMKWTTNVILLFLSAVNNNVIIYFLMFAGVDYENNTIDQQCMLFWNGIGYILW